MKTKNLKLRGDVSLPKQTNQISDWVILLIFVAIMVGFVTAVAGFIYLVEFIVSLLY